MILTKLARLSIESYFSGIIYDPDNKTKQKYKEKKACFVTLNVNNELNGCIGSLNAYQALYKDVISNAINAAFKDYRFKPLVKQDLSKLKIEVSVLSASKELKYLNETDLLNKLKPNYGIILEKWNHSATFLPQVWIELPDKLQFLEQLSLKAGLRKDDWKFANYKYYTVKKYTEK